MTNRREFLQTGIAASALPLSINALLSPSTAEASGRVRQVSLYKAIFDRRYAEGHAFAREVARFRVPTHELQYGDITEVYDELDVLWRKEQVAIAGLTQFGPLFVLERLARERDMRVALRVEHQVRADGTLAHIVAAHPETMALAEQLSSRELEWPTIMAALASHCRPHDAAPTAGTIVTPGGRPILLHEPAAQVPESIIHYYMPGSLQAGHGVPLDGSLYSWVITPASRAERPDVS
jgi:hypothetical protein